MPQIHRKKERRNISIDHELDSWLSSDDVDNASELIADLLKAYRAYRDLDDAAKYIREKERAAQEPRDRR